MRTEITTAGAGFIKYNPGVLLGVLVPSPVPGAKDVFATITDWTEAVGTAASARTATAVGTIIRPATASLRNTGIVHECTTAGTAGSTEPTWATVRGKTTSDNSVTWTAITERVQTKGVYGVTFGATSQTDGNINAVFATPVVDYKDGGDAAQNTTFIPVG